MVISDAIVRLLDDGISKQSLEIESFDNNLLECPQYTRPYDFYGDKVPAVLLSGNHRDIKHYNDKMALRETLKYRPDLLENHQFTKEEIALLEEIRNEFEG